ELSHQYGGGLRPDAGDAPNVVDGIAREGEIVREALGCDAEPPRDIRIRLRVAGTVVPQHVALADELCEILVAREKSGANPAASHPPGERAENVVCLVIGAAYGGEAEQLRELEATLELQRQAGRCRSAVRLVCRVDAGAKAARETVVEPDGDMLRLRALDEIAEHPRKPEYRVRRVPVAMHLLRAKCVIGAENVNRCVDQVDQDSQRWMRSCSGLDRGKCASRYSIWSASTRRPLRKMYSAYVGVKGTAMSCIFACSGVREAF